MNRWRPVLLGVGAVGAASVLLALASRVHAQQSPVINNEQVEVTAEQLLVDVHQGTAMLQGHVKLRRGTLTVSCAKLQVRYDNAPSVTWARASGEVEAQVGDMRARAAEAELQVDARRLRLSGGVRVARAGAWLEGERADVDLQTGHLTLDKVRGAIPLPAGSARVDRDP